MFGNLSERLDRSFKLLKGEGKITKINVVETLRGAREALLDADVNYKVAKSFADTVEEKVLGQNVLTSIKPNQLMVKIVHDELANLMGGTTVDVNLQGNPATILISGLQGSGKTTFAGKPASLLKTKKNKKPLSATCDVYRPAAIERLHVVKKQVGVPVYMELENKNPVEIAMNAIREARAKGNDIVIVDTAGHLVIDEQMMNEIAAIKGAIQPDETLLVIDAMADQDAVSIAREFNERLNFDGVVLTKSNGDTRGSVALSIRTVIGKPIKLVGMGEKMDASDIFHPERTADRILNIGGIVSSVERAQERYNEEEAKRLRKRIARSQFDFSDFISRIQQIKKMDNLKELTSMTPDVGEELKDVNIDDSTFKNIEAIVYSMIPDECNNPVILNGSHRQRITKGSGTGIQGVNKLIKQFSETHKIIRILTSAKPGKMKLSSVRPSFRR